MIDLAFSLGLAMATLVVVIAYAGRVSRSGAARDARIERAGTSPLLGKAVMEMGYWAMRPVARACITLGLTANAVSWISLALAALAGISLAAGDFGVGAVFSLVSSACDALDGMIARETGTASDAGEVLDAAIDRYAELLFFGGIVVHERLDAFAIVLHSRGHGGRDHGELFDREGRGAPRPGPARRDAPPGAGGVPRPGRGPRARSSRPRARERARRVVRARAPCSRCSHSWRSSGTSPPCAG